MLHGKFFQGRTKVEQTGVKRPLARIDGLIVEEHGDEVLIYDREHDLAHCLGPVAATVWNACDGTKTPTQLSSELDLDVDVVERAIGDLGGFELLQRGPGSVGGTTRRELTVRTAKAGAMAALVPTMMVSIVAPASAASASEIARCKAVQTGNNCGLNCHQACCCCCSPSTGDKLCAPAVRKAGDDYCADVLKGNCTGGGTGGACPS